MERTTNLDPAEEKSHRHGVPAPKPAAKVDSRFPPIEQLLCRFDQFEDLLART